jgi:hypothetical protein
MSSRHLNFSLTAKLWRWPGDMGWHFINLDKPTSSKIRKLFPKGFVKIKAKLGQTDWNTSLFPHTETGVYLLAIKKSVRKKEELMEGDIVKVNFTLL